MNCSQRKLKKNAQDYIEILCAIFKFQTYFLTQDHHEKLVTLITLFKQISTATPHQPCMYYFTIHLKEENLNLVFAILQKAIELKPKNPRAGEVKFYLTYLDNILNEVLRDSIDSKLSIQHAEEKIGRYCSLFQEITAGNGTFINRPVMGIMYYDKAFTIDTSYFEYIRILICTLRYAKHLSDIKILAMLKILAKNTRVTIEYPREKLFESMLRSVEDEPETKAKMIREFVASRRKENLEDEPSFHDIVKISSVYSIIDTLITNYPALLADENLISLSKIVTCCAIFIQCNATHFNPHSYNIFRPAMDILQPYLSGEKDIVKYLPFLQGLTSTLCEVGSINKPMKKNDYSIINIILQTVLDFNPDFLLAPEQKKLGLTQIMTELLQKIESIEATEPIEKTVLWTFDQKQFYINSNPNIRNEILITTVKNFTILMSHIALIEHEQNYQTAIKIFHKSYLHADGNVFFNNLVFIDAIVAPLLRSKQIDASAQRDMDKLALIRKKLSNIPCSDTKKNIITRYFVKPAIDNFEFYQNIFSNFSDLEQCYIVLAKNMQHRLRLLCEVVFSDFIRERPDCYKNARVLLENLRKLINALAPKFESKLPEMAPKFLTMIFRINQKLDLSDQFTGKMVDALKHIKSTEQLKTLKLILQYCPNIEDLTSILEKETMSHQQHPNRDEFRLLSPNLQLSWLKYYSVMRVRQGLGALNHVLKNTSNFNEDALATMLSSFSRIGITASSAKLSRISQLLQHPSNKVRAYAARAIWFIEQNPINTSIKYKLISELISTEDVFYQISLLNTLSYYKFSSEDIEPWLNVVKKSKSLTNPITLKHYALAMAKFPCKESLLRALEIVNSPVWDEYNYCANYHQRKYTGDFLLFLHRPHWQDNRALMYRRIKRILALVETVKIDVAPKEITQGAEKLKEKITKGVSKNRFEDIQLTLPKNRVLLRGICAKHGDDLESKAVVDFIMKGAGSLELQDQSDDKASHAAANNIYSTNNIDEGIAYYKQQSGILIAIKCEYFNTETLRGFTRTQQETVTSRHFIFLRGVPLYAIEKVFFPESFSESLKRLHGNESIKALLLDQNFMFHQLDKHQLHQMRHSIRQFYNRIIFVKDNDSIRALLINNNLSTPSPQEVCEVTLQEHIRGEMIAQKMGPRFWNYHVPRPKNSFVDLFGESPTNSLK